MSEKEKLFRSIRIFVNTCTFLLITYSVLIVLVAIGKVMLEG